MAMSIAFTYAVLIRMQNFILGFLMGICILVLCTDNPVDLNKNPYEFEMESPGILREQLYFQI